jgi:hypothetical protein
VALKKESTMKIVINILIFLTLISGTFCHQKRTESTSNRELINIIDSVDFDIRGFKQLPQEYAFKDRAYLIDKIIPSYHYSYWECVFKDFLTDDNRGRLIVYNGDSLNFSSHAKNINSNNGFFVECHPGICFSYIVGVRSDKTIELINSGEKLKDFIGNINNIEEAILIAKINDLWFDTDTIIGGAYKERENDYLMYLLEYSSTPVTYKSVKAVLTKTGDFKVIEKTIYKQTDDYFIE